MPQSDYERGTGGGADTAQATVHCPYFRHVAGHAGYPVQGYCERPSKCGLRVPVLAELRLLCTTGNYRRCAIYRFGTEAA